jgi:hypothetical protein
MLAAKSFITYEAVLTHAKTLLNMDNYLLQPHSST